jgi:hypothetical protein
MQDFFMLASAMAGALGCYLGSSAQRWLRAPLKPRIAQPVALLLLAMALASGASSEHPATSLAVVFTAVMAVFVAAPFIGAMLRQLRPADDAR